jgi:single-strand DNA-binding protein
MSFQQIQLVGNLGRDPELRYTPSGQAVCNMNIATNRTYTRSDTQEKVEETVWFRVTAWGRMAETCNQYLSKGRQVLVVGRIIADENGNPRLWDRQDGTKGASFEVNAQTVRFLGSNGSAAQTVDTPDIEEGEDEIPF